MAGNAVIGALRVVIGADTAALQAGLKKAQSGLDQFAAQAKIAGVAAAVAIGAAMVAIGASIKNTIDEADKLGKMAQSIGIPVEELSRLKHAADLSGIGMEQLGISVGRLSRNMTEASSNIKGDAARAFQALGISVKNTDGTLKSSTQVMDEIATKFAGMEDGAGKTALAIALFGRSGAALIPMLNAGAKGLEEMRTEADKLGIVISDKTFRAAEAFNDNLKRLEAAKQGVVTQITARLLPALQSLSEAFVQGAKNSELLKATGDILSNIMRGAATVFAVLGFVVIDVIQKLGRLFETLKAFATLDFSKGIEIAKQSAVEANARFSALSETIKKLWSDMSKAPASIGMGPEKIAAPIIAAADAAKNALESFLISQKKNIASMQAEAAAFFLAAGARERMKIELQAATIASENNIIVTEAMRKKITEAGLAAEQMASKLAGLRILEEIMPAWERQNLEMERAAKALQSVGASAAVVQAAFLRIQFPSLSRAIEEATNLKGRIDSLVTSSINSLADALTDVVSGTKTAADAFKSFATSVIKDLANMAIKAALFQTLSSVFGFTSPAVSTGFKLPGFATGGSFNVGGAGGIDSQVVAFKATPGEHVSVGNDEGPGGASSMDVTVVVHGNGDKDLMNKMHVGAMTAVKQALGQYDKNLPTRVHQIAGDTRAR